MFSYSMFDVFSAADPVFTQEECNKIISLGGLSKYEEVTIPELAGFATATIPLSKEASWILEKVSPLVETTNKESFDFDVQGFSEGMLLIRCRPADVQEGVTLSNLIRMDLGKFVAGRRKLVVCVKLTEAGAVVFEHVPAVILKSQGTISIAPSYVPYIVTRTDDGSYCYILVAWVSGEDSFS